MSDHPKKNSLLPKFCCLWNAKVSEGVCRWCAVARGNDARTNTINDSERKHWAKRRAEAERWHAARQRWSDVMKNKLAPKGIGIVSEKWKGSIQIRTRTHRNAQKHIVKADRLKRSEPWSAQIKPCNKKKKKWDKNAVRLNTVCLHAWIKTAQK